ncbi:unnamed protein product [Sphagnum jensenii]|uniref:Uncharacterized protein n=1 Tax=Sphagnum jensenii TaxID=128206 RepID=A0ABP1B8C0_9BRYO
MFYEVPTLLDAHNVHVVGTGEEIVVLGHGFGTDQSVWKHVLPHLVEEYRVILYDMMGAGTTDPEYFSVLRYSTLHGYADDLLTILDELEAWVSGFAPLAVGADIDSTAVQEFGRTLFNIRPDIAFNVAKTIFEIDMRFILPQVIVPCHILQSNKDLAVPVIVSDHLHHALGGPTIVEILQTEGHLPQLSSPDVVIPVLKRHLVGNIRA